MLLLTTLCFILLSKRITAAAIPITAHARRDEPPDIPTFTFGPGSQYVVATPTDPEPSAGSLQVYPTGVVDDIPKDGINVAFGPDLRQKIKSTMVDNCKDKPEQQCRDALLPVLQNTDVSLHAKRFVTLALFGLVFVIHEVMVLEAEAIYLNEKGPPQEIHFKPGDLEQIHDIGNASVIAIETPGGGTAVPPAITAHPPTLTATDFISVETLTADNGTHKKGDVVYNIPEPAAKRIQDFLGMMGAQEASKKCTQAQKRADITEECRRTVVDFAQPFLGNAPDNLMQMAQANPAPNPDPGQVLNIAAPHLLMNNAEAVRFLYREMFVIPLQEVEEFDPARLAKAAVVLTIVLHALMYYGDQLLQVYIPQNELVTGLKEDDFMCRKDLLCVDNDCQAQKDDEQILIRKAVCQAGKYINCKCHRINQPYVYEVDHDYMDNQYAWLEELIGATTLADAHTTCNQDHQDLPGAVDKFNDKINQACKDHSELKKRGELGRRDDINYVPDAENGFTWGIYWEDKGDCPFDCYSVFSLFSTNQTCVDDNGLLKYGVVSTQCGTASYNAYNLTDHTNG